MSVPATSYLLFAACSPGLEPLLREELDELGLRSEVHPGGVELRGDAAALWTVCRASRLAESVRVRLKSFVARDFETLMNGFRRLPWHAYVAAGGWVDVAVTCHKSRLWHSGAVAERLLDVLRERRVVRESTAAEPGLGVYVRLVRDRVQVSVDASGERLHRRGYRTHVAEASLRETLAAALVRVARQEAPRARMLWDPFCGAGTIPLEWLEDKLGRSPGARRRFAFEEWPAHDPVAYESWLSACGDARSEDAESAAFPWRILGSDVSERAIDAAQANARRAGLEPHCRWLVEDFERAASQVPSGTLVISNPPYGVRIEDADAGGPVLRRLGGLLRRRRDLRPVVLLVPRRTLLAGDPSQPWIELLRTSNGGLPVSIRLLRAAPGSPP